MPLLNRTTLLILLFFSVLLYVLFKFNQSIEIDEQLMVNNCYAILNNDILEKSKCETFSNYIDKYTNSKKNIFQIASLTKLFTSTAILKLVSENKISFDDKVFQILSPNKNESTYKDKRIENITVKQLLEHQSGINSSKLKHPYPVWNNFYSQMTRLDFSEWFTQNILNSTPGTNTSYSNINYLLLSLVIEKITKQSYENYIKDNILIPLEMYNTEYYKIQKEQKKTHSHLTTDKNLNPNLQIGSGGYISTINDMSKFILEFNNGFKAIGIKLKIYNLIQETAYKKEHHEYSLGWRIMKNASGKLSLEHFGSINGVFTQFFYMPENKKGWIILSNIPISSNRSTLWSIDTQFKKYMFSENPILFFNYLF